MSVKWPPRIVPLQLMVSILFICYSHMLERIIRYNNRRNYWGKGEADKIVPKSLTTWDKIALIPPSFKQCNITLNIIHLQFF